MYILRIISYFTLLICLFINVSNGARGRFSDVDPNVELKMRWKDLSLKTICEEEEWKNQFMPVKEKFAKCLGLKKIIIDDNDPDDDVDRLSFFRGESHNPFCKIAKTWDACTHFLEGMNCIESNAAELLKGRNDGISGMMDDGNNKNFNPDHMNAMTRVFKMQCDMAKLASNYGPFGSHGYGMDYFGDYDMPPDIDPDGLPPAGDL